MAALRASDPEQPLRVLIVVNQLANAGGAEVSLREQLTAMAQRADVVPGLVVLRSATTDLGDLVHRGVQAYVPAGGLGPVTGIPQVVKAIRAFRPHVVHTTLADANTAGRLAAKLCGVPAITSLVNTPYVQAAYRDREVSRLKHGVVRSVDKLLGHHATSAFHAISDVAAQHAIDVLKVSPEKVHVVSRGRDPGRLGLRHSGRRSAARQALGVDGAPVILNVGRQVPQKGQRHLIAAMPRVWERYPDALLLIAGRRGDATDVLHSEVERVSGGDRIQLLGERNDVGDLLCAADVFAFPSLYEGLGGSLLEAMALEIPIVAAASPAVSEVLDAGRSGLLVEVANADELATGLLQALAGGAEISVRVAHARHAFENKHSMDAVVEGVLALYQHVSGPAGPSA